MLKIYKEDFTVRSYQTDLNARMKPSAILEVMQEAAGQHSERLGLGRSALLAKNTACCHNLADMYNAKNPMVAKMHAGFIDKPTNCIMCHKTAGHNYKMADEIIKATGKWPDPAKAWEQADAAAKK